MFAISAFRYGVPARPIERMWTSYPRPWPGSANGLSSVTGSVPWSRWPYPRKKDWVTKRVAPLWRLMARLGPLYRDLEVRWVDVGGEPMCLLASDTRTRVAHTLDLAPSRDRIQAVYGLVNPAKLAHLQVDAAPYGMVSPWSGTDAGAPRPGRAWSPPGRRGAW